MTHLSTDHARHCESSGSNFSTRGRRLRQALVLLLMLAFAAPSTLLAQESVKPIEAVEPVEPPPLKLKDPLEFEDPEGWDYIKPVGWILFTNGMFWGVARVILDK